MLLLKGKNYKHVLQYHKTWILTEYAYNITFLYLNIKGFKEKQM